MSIEKNACDTRVLFSEDVEEYLREHGAKVAVLGSSYWDAPVHDGLYHVRFSLDPAYLNPRFEGTYKKTGQRYEGVYLEAEIIRAIEQAWPGDFEGWKLQFFVNTLSFRGRTSSLTRVLQAIRKSHQRQNASTLVELLTRAKPEALVTVMWRAYSRQEQQYVLQGMRAFPENDGKKLHRFCRYGEDLQARAHVTGYRPIPPHSSVSELEQSVVSNPRTDPWNTSTP